MEFTKCCHGHYLCGRGTIICIYKGGHQGPERLRDWTRVPQLTGCRARCRRRIPRQHCSASWGRSQQPPTPTPGHTDPLPPRQPSPSVPPEISQGQAICLPALHWPWQPPIPPGCRHTRHSTLLLLRSNERGFFPSEFNFTPETRRLIPSPPPAPSSGALWAPPLVNSAVRHGICVFCIN